VRFSKKEMLKEALGVLFICFLCVLGIFIVANKLLYKSDHVLTSQEVRTAVQPDRVERVEAVDLSISSVTRRIARNWFANTWTIVNNGPGHFSGAVSVVVFTPDNIFVHEVTQSLSLDKGGKKRFTYHSNVQPGRLVLTCPRMNLCMKKIFEEDVQ